MLSSCLRITKQRESFKRNFTNTLALAQGEIDYIFLFPKDKLPFKL